MGIVGAGFVGPHHIDAVRRLGFVDVVAIAGSSDASAQAEGGRPRRAEGLRQLRGAARRSRRARRAQRDAQLPALSGERGRDRQGQARRLRQAAGDDGRRSARSCSSRRRRPGVVHAVTFNYRGNPLVQQARTRLRAATSARRTSSSATTCRTGCSRTPTTRGGSSPTRAAPRRRSATSARTGATSRSTSPGCASRTCSATSRR